MASFSVRALKRWYRDSNGLPKKLIAKSRYLTGRFQVRAVRLVWTLLTLPIQLVAWILLTMRPSKSVLIFQKLVLRNPWITGALPGLIRAAESSGEITTAIGAALKYDRLHQKNHGLVADLWTEYLIGEPGWVLPKLTPIGTGKVVLDRKLFNKLLLEQSRTPNYTESKLAVVAEKLAKQVSEIDVQIESEQDVDLALLAISLKSDQLSLGANLRPVETRTEIAKRRAKKFAELKSAGLIEVKS